MVQVIIEGPGAEEKMLLNRTIKYYVNIISFLAAVSWY
jgi:hypothetical protein